MYKLFRIECYNDLNCSTRPLVLGCADNATCTRYTRLLMALQLPLTECQVALVTAAGPQLQWSTHTSRSIVIGLSYKPTPTQSTLCSLAPECYLVIRIVNVRNEVEYHCPYHGLINVFE